MGFHNKNIKPARLQAQTIVLDCDNTFGIPFKDIDDGLALSCLLSATEVELLGITTTFGNGSIEQVQRQTQRMLRNFGRTNIPVYRGASSAQSGENKAANYLAELAAVRPGEITLVATGPLTNIKEATQIDPSFLSNLKRIICMGGYRSPIWFGRRHLREINFSCDPEAARIVLDAPCHVVLVDADVCPQVLFGRAEVETLCNIEGLPISFGRAVHVWWLAWMASSFTRGFCPWDLVAAIYLLRPDLFLGHSVKYRCNMADLAHGKLQLEAGDEFSNLTLLTHIIDPQAVINILAESLTTQFAGQYLQRAANS